MEFNSGFKGLKKRSQLAVLLFSVFLLFTLCSSVSHFSTLTSHHSATKRPSLHLTCEKKIADVVGWGVVG